MVVIRLSRTGRKKTPSLSCCCSRLTLQETVVESNKSGATNHLLESEACLELNVERHDYWLSKGAQPSDRVKYLYKNLDKLTSATNPTRAQAKKEQASASSKAKPAAKIDEKTEETEA